jgi:hypothetical protein
VTTINNSYTALKAFKPLPVAIVFTNMISPIQLRHSAIFGVNMGQGRKRSTLKMNRKKAQRKLKARIKRAIEAGKKK